jgi:hypothetical protein
MNERQELRYELKFAEALIDDLLIRRFRHFKEAEAVVRLEPRKEVEELMSWGLQNDEPMAIYLAEKIAMITNQVISHPLALRTSRYLSHRREVPAERVERCKDCLKVVGRINRDNIYDFGKEYEHITVRKHFNEYLEKRNSELSSTALEFLSRVDPSHNYQTNPSNLKSSLRRAHLVV